MKIGLVVPRVVAWGWGTEGWTDAQADMTKLIVAFRSVGQTATEAVCILEQNISY
jgi:hypothetical protein